MILFSCKLNFRVRIKKNGKELIKRGGRIIPVSSKKFIEWEQEASWEILKVKPKEFPPISDYCTVVYIFNFKDRKNEPDTSNCVEGIADVLEQCGIITNDKLIKNFYADKRFNGEDSLEVYILPKTDTINGISKIMETIC